MTTIGIIPARGGSKGVPKKNIRQINGLPLIQYTIESALKSSCLQQVIVSTDSEEIASIAKSIGANVPFIRPAELATDEASSIDVLKHAIKEVENLGTSVDHIMLLQPTSPLRTNKQIEEAHNIYTKNGHIPIVSVCKTQSHPYIMKRIKERFLEDFIEKPSHMTRRQDFPELYELNGAIYITKKENVQSGFIYRGNCCLPYIMDFESSLDIDEELDFFIAEAILKKRSVLNENW
jgi:CMP-N,N'-diacetyllegionaminic acid synthase